MSGFTFTAPFISEEDEKRELEELSEGEAAALKEDFFGSANTPCHEQMPDHVYLKGVRFVEEAIESMQLSKKEAYVKAKEAAPGLVQSECPCRTFLDSTSFDFWKAADLVVNYWSLRLSLFGENRAFLPMTLDGAMAEDIDCLKEGTMIHVDDDDQGRPVHFYDRVRMDTRTVFTRKKFLRVFFYMHQLRFDRPHAFVALVNWRGYELYKHYDRKFSKEVINLSQAFPGKVKALHVCIDGSCRSVVNLVMPIYKHMYGKYMRMRMVIHCGNGPLEILKGIQEYGMRQQHAEIVFGGILYNPGRAKEWLNERREIETTTRRKHQHM